MNKGLVNTVLILGIVGFVISFYHFLNYVNSLAHTEYVWLIPAVVFALAVVGKYLLKGKFLFGMSFIFQLAFQAVLIRDYSAIYDAHPTQTIYAGLVVSLHLWLLFTVYDIDQPDGIKKGK